MHYSVTLGHDTQNAHIVGILGGVYTPRLSVEDYIVTNRLDDFYDESTSINKLRVINTLFWFLVATQLAYMRILDPQ